MTSDITESAALAVAIAYSFLEEAFTDMAVAFHGVDKAAARPLLSDIEERCARHMHGVLAEMGGDDAAKIVCAEAANRLRDTILRTREAMLAPRH